MRSNTSFWLVMALAASAAAMGSGCSCGDGTEASGSASSNTNGSASTSVGGNNTGGNNTGGSGASMGSSTGGAPTVIAECQGKVYECGDLIDNDGDGKIDSQDPDCLGPCDNTEDSYYGGIPGQPGPACTVDCYFDQDSGAGNDNCYWNHKCDPNEVAPGYHPESVNGASCEYDPNANTPGTGASCDDLYNMQSQVCYDYCGPLTPNGCDCFGCCELPAGSGSYVWLGSDDGSKTGTCDIANVNDPNRCEPCLPVAACLNECGPCEICIGKPEPDPGCGGSGGAGGSGAGGAPGQCPEGVQECGLAGQPECPADYYCITGCCQFIPQ